LEVPDMTRLSIHLLAAFDVVLDGEPVTAFESDKVRALLAYLAVEADRPHRREALAGLLWPDWPERSARASLSQALYNLRSAIGDREADTPFLLVAPQTIQFNRASDHVLDIAILANLPDDATADQLKEALDSYDGPFLAGFSLPDASPFEEWALATREELHRLALEVATKLAGYYESRGDYPLALRFARRGITLEPTWEAGHRAVIRNLALSGERAAALAHYDLCCQTLEAELGVEPSEETQTLFDLLVKGELPAPLTAAPPVPDRPPRAVGPCPYRGLAAFREEDAPFFFGREPFVARLLAAVRQRSLVAVIVGSSGSGKSSAIYAGLVPQLRQHGNETRWRISDCRPGTNPFQSLAAALIPLLEPDLWETDRLIETRKLGDALRDGRLSLQRVVERALDKESDDAHLLLILDQFEELYTLCPDPELRQRFIDELLATVAAWHERRASPFVALLTLRADFMGQALAHRPFADALQTASIMMGPMTRDELQEAIVKPAEVQGAAFEEGLVERLLDDVGQEPGRLPLLEFALTLLWEHHNYGWLTHEAYEVIGRVEGALARHADQVFSELHEAEQEQARRVFVQLVRPGEGTEDTRRVATLAELGEENWELIRHLADRRLVVTGRDPGSGDETAEVVHEALISRWDQLRSWMDADRAFRTWQERLRAALRGWEAAERDEGALLRGVPLAEAENWLSQRDAELSPLEREYIDAGTALHERREAEREAQRQRELEAARQLAEERAQSAARLRRRALWLGFALILALVAAGVAGLFGQQSQRNAKLASTQEAQAVANAELAATNAAEALSNADLAATRQADAEEEAELRATAEAQAIANAELASTREVRAEAEANLRATAEAEAVLERDEAQRQHMIAEEQASIAFSRELAAASLNNLTVDPELSLLLALEAVSAADTWEAQSALHRALPEMHLLHTFDAHTDIVQGLAVSPDGTWAATASQDHTVRIWETETGRELLSFMPDGPLGAVTDIAFSSDKTLLATGGYNNDAKVWELVENSTGTLEARLLSTMVGHTGAVIVIDFSPDAKRLATGSNDTTARIWDVTSGEELLLLSGHKLASSLTRNFTGISDTAFHPDGDQLITSGADGTVRIWDIGSGEELLALFTHEAGTHDLALSPDGTHIATAGEDLMVKYWDLSSGLGQGELLRAISVEAEGVDLSPDGRILATINVDGSAHLWNLADGRELSAFYGHLGGWVQGVTFTPDGERLVTIGSDETAKVWDLSPGRELVTLPGLLVAHRPGGDHMAVADMASISLWQSPQDFSVAEVTQTLSFPIPPSRGLKYSPDGSRLVTAGFDGTARIWDAESGRELLVLEGHTDQVWSADLNADNTRAATASWDGTVRVWDATTGEELLTLRPPNWSEFDALYQITFSPDGMLLVVCAYYPFEDDVAWVWDVGTGELLFTLPTDSDPMTPAFHPDGNLLAIGDSKGTTTLWDISSGTGKLIARMEGHTTGVHGIVFDPLRERLATASGDGTAKLWDARTGAELLTLSAHSGPVISISISPDGTRLATGSRDGTVRVYTLLLDELVTLARERVTRSLTDEECQRFLHLAQCP
jgi:WD40 repeat protein/DNA-binding SARP family transcriptional activator